MIRGLGLLVRRVGRRMGAKIKPVIPEVTDVEKTRRDEATNKKIQELLEAPEIIDYDKPFEFKGNLILCPTPIGNLKDLSFRAFEALQMADLIACEDTRTTGKLLTLLKDKKFGERLDEILGTKDKFDPNAQSFEESLEADENVFADFAEKRRQEVTPHPHEPTVKRLKHKIRDYHQQMELQETRQKAHTILTQNDSLGFLTRYAEAEAASETQLASRKAPGLGEVGALPFVDEKALEISADQAKENDDEQFYDTHSKTRKKNKEAHAKDMLDDEFITFVKRRIYESKLRKGRGLLLSCHRFNEEERVESLLKCMRAGLKVVLVPDAGSPCLSDPGQMLVNEAIKNKIAIESLPGPNSVVLALTASGFPGNNFSFLSFWPKNEGEEKQFIDRIKKERCTTIFFENKNRIMTTLLTLEKNLGRRQMVCVAVEMTKLHERMLRGTVEHVYETLNKNPDYTIPSLKGELTVVVAPYRREYNLDLLNLDELLNEATERRNKSLYGAIEVSEATIDLNKLIRVLNDSVSISTKDLSVLLSKALKMPKNKLYERIVSVKKLHPGSEEEDLETPETDAPESNGHK